MQNKENFFLLTCRNLEEKLKNKFKFSFIQMNYSNKRVIHLFYSLEFVKEATSFKLGLDVDVSVYFTNSIYKRWNNYLLFLIIILVKIKKNFNLF